MIWCKSQLMPWSVCQCVYHVPPSSPPGIAPFRSFWRRLFHDGLPGIPSNPEGPQEAGGYKGYFWMIAGFANQVWRCGVTVYRGIDEAKQAAWTG